MTTIPKRAEIIALSSLMLLSQAMEMGLSPERTADLLEALIKLELEKFQNEILESQRQTAEALGAALRKAGK